jgi:hypothetical protein
MKKSIAPLPITTPAHAAILSNLLFQRLLVPTRNIAKIKLKVAFYFFSFSPPIRLIGPLDRKRIS